MDLEWRSKTGLFFRNRNPPSFVEFFGYMFSFQSILAGPLCFYKDHIDFMTGSNLIKYQVNLLKQRNKQPISSIIF